MGAVLGIDYGEKRIGLAISTEDKSFTFPRDTITRVTNEQSIAAIKQLCDNENVTEVVLGLPLDQNGDEGTAAQSVRRFGDSLAEKLGMTMQYQDERFSSTESKQQLRSAGAKEKSMRGQVDQGAAVLILQTYLERVYGRQSLS